MPGYEGSGEDRVASEMTITQKFTGDGSNGQKITLSMKPLEPLLVEQWNNDKKKWDLIPESKYAVSEKDITLNNSLIIPTTPEYNIRVTFNPYDPSGAENKEVGIEAVGGGVATMQISGAAPSVDQEFVLSLATGKARITRVRVVRTNQVGTAYTVNSRLIEIFDTTQGPPTHPTITSLFRAARLEPNAYGELVSKTNIQLGDTVFENISDVDFGKILIRITALGGDGTSVEDYELKVQGIELQ
jgi:hypothetical protein